jgi:antitoxin FitA
MRPAGGAYMPSLSIRRLDENTYLRLKERAARHGVSLEEEVRQILIQATAPPERLGDLFLEVFGPSRGVDLSSPRCKPHEPVELKP